MEFVKLQATGNDFVIVDARRLKRNWVSLAKAICDRRFGVGSDGLILLLNSSTADWRMRMFNPDGSEAEACGNGLRCFARYIMNAGLAGPDKQLKVETAGGLRTITPLEGASSFRVGMGVPGLKPEEIPLAVQLEGAPVTDYPLKVRGRKLMLSFVSMGNPHGVSFVEDVEAFPLAEIGPAVENHDMFPHRLNFEIARVLSRRAIRARVWERGAGETLSCGTGACAVAVAARLHGYINDRVQVELAGGKLNVEWDGKGQVYLNGPAEAVFNGEWPETAVREGK
jgi:diaminopimelate epimerase